MRAYAALALGLAACQPPPLSLRFVPTDGPTQRCIADDTDKETTDCSKITMLCTGVLSIRVVPPDDPNVPVISVCQPLVGKSLCSIASIDLPAPTMPVREQVLEVQMAIFESGSLQHDDNDQPICPRVDFAANNLAVSARSCAENEICPPEPAVAGRAYYHPGDSETVVELGCPHFDLLRTCNPPDTLDVVAAVNDFETAVSVSPSAADRLLVSIGEPQLETLLGSYFLPTNAAFALPRTVPGPIPGWGVTIENPPFDASVCIQALEDISGATATLTCASPIPAKTIDQTGYRLPRATLAQILAALSLPELPLEGLVIGIVLNQFYTPVQGATVTADSGTIKYLSADRMSVTTTATSSNGIFISEDAIYGSKFRWNGQESIGGVVEGKVTIVVLRQSFDPM